MRTAALKTRAAVCRKFGAPLTIEEVELAEPGQGEIRVKIAACAICHSDIFFWEGAWGGELPAVFGHEAAGIVEAVGPGVTRLKVGDPVVATLIRSCGFCPSCSGGAPVFCEEVFDLDRVSPLKDRDGHSIVHGMRIGAFAEHVVVHHSQVAAVPVEMKLDVASLIACGVLTGFGAVANTAEVGAGASVVVIGCGGVGLNSVQGARVVGATPIIAIDVADGKLEAARAFGATHTINAKTEDVSARVGEITKGRKADFVFVTVGVRGAAEQAISLTARNGAAVLVGMPPSGVSATFDPGWLAADGQRILGSKMGSARLPVDVPKLVELYTQGRLKLDELITERFPFERINDAIASSRAGAALRNVVVF
jgi:S-(hydroxymethyl)glutathione dehydrogenase / alcohol dehydrogenase